MRDKILNYVKSQEDLFGGVIDIPGKSPSAILTAGLIPTLLDYGEIEFAERCANWLVSSQKPTGLWVNHNGQASVYDSAYIIRHLRIAEKRIIADHDFQVVIERAVGYLESHDHSEYFVAAQVEAAIGSKAKAPPIVTMANRTQSLLITAQALPKRDQKMIVKLVSNAIRPDGLVYFDMAGNGSDIVSTALLGILNPSLAGDLIKVIEPWVNADGSIPVIAGTPDKSTWVNKYVLDLYKVAE